MRIFIGVLLAAVFTTNANADAARFGIGAGRATIEADDFDLEGRATAWEIFGGYEFNEYLAIEAGYINGGKAKDSIQGIVVEANTSAIAASVVGSVPVSEAISFFGRAGYMHWESDQQARFDGDVLATADVDGNDPFFGAGVAWGLDGALLRFEYRIASLDDSDLSLLSLAVVWRFGAN